jgi:hypothetical protein
MFPLEKELNTVRLSGRLFSSVPTQNHISITPAPQDPTGGSRFFHVHRALLSGSDEFDDHVTRAVAFEPLVREDYGRRVHLLDDGWTG